MPAKQHPKIVAIANQKGGVGKTTLSLEIAAAVSSLKNKVLLIDMDPQANATDTLIGEGQAEFTIHDVLASGKKDTLHQAITPTHWTGVDLVASELNAQDVETINTTAAEFRLRQAMQPLDRFDDYDLILIDCPPSAGRLTVNAFVAADHVLVVTMPSKHSNSGVGEILTTIDTIKETMNPDLSLAGVILTNVPARGKEATFRVRELEEGLGDKLWQPYLPSRAILAEAHGNNRSLRDLQPSRTHDLISRIDQYALKLTDKEL